MRYLVLQLLLVSTFAFARSPASCQVSDKSVVSRSSSGAAQVSNLGLIQIRCHVAARPWPLEPGVVRNGLKAETTVYQISADGTRSLVPSEVNVSGGGLSDAKEWVDFYINIPLDPAERDAEIRRYLANLERLMADEPLPEQDRQQQEEQVHHWRMNPQALAAIISQYRVGRFQVDCRVLDGGRVIGVGRVDLEVLFKGRFSEAALGKK